MDFLPDMTFATEFQPSTRALLQHLTLDEHAQVYEEIDLPKLLWHPEQEENARILGFPDYRPPGYSSATS